MSNTITKYLREENWIKLLISKATGVYIVGGCVRDGFLNKPIKDIDLVVDGLSINTVKKMLTPFGGVQIVGESFAAIKFRPEGHVGEDYDVVVPRIDRKIGAGHKGFEVVTEGVGIIEDLKRRDFTINSMAINVATDELLDPFNGLKDMKAKLLRATDKNAFIEDPLRMMRGIQFAARFSFNIEQVTLALMKRNASLIGEIKGERIREEFDKILKKNGSTRVAFDLLYRSNLDKGLFGQKFINDEFQYFDNLDLVSFYYVLGTLGDVDPAEFYKKRLKGEYIIIKALQDLDSKFEGVENMNEADKKWTLLMAIKSSPKLAHSHTVIPQSLRKYLADMHAGKIPMKMGDIPISGNELMDEFGVQGEELGRLIVKLYKGALMNKFDWKNKEKSLDFLRNK